MLTITTSTGSRFDLIPGTKLSIEETSVMFSDSGSFSLPLELPDTANNLAILEYPHRTDRRRRFISSLDVVVASGVWVRHARMDIESASKNRSITASLFFRESPFYAKIKNITLPDIFKSKVREDFGKDTTALNLWYDHLSRVMCGDVSDDFYVFPVCVKIEHKEVSESDGDLTLKTTWTRFVILNRQTVPLNDGVEMTSTDAYGRKYYSLVGSSYSYTDEGVEYRLPVGYGWAPFLKFTYVVHYVFQQLGYTLEQSLFDTDESFGKMCFIHNTADCMVRGYLEYSQIVPEMDLVDFFKFIENSFGCRFAIDEVNKTVTPRFWQSVIDAVPVKDYSGAFEDNPVLTFSQKSGLKLTVERHLPEATPVAFKTYPEMFAKYGPYGGSFKNSLLFQTAANSGSLQPGVYLMQNSRKYVALGKYYRDPINNPGIFDWVTIPIEIDTLDYYDTEADYPLEERPSGFNKVVLKDVALRGETDKRRNVTTTAERGFAAYAAAAFNELLNTYIPNDGLIGRIPYIDSLRHVNTAIETISTKDNVSSSQIEKEDEVSLPVFLGFYHGYAAAETVRVGIEKTFFGSADSYNNIGDKVGTFDLSLRSLYSTFWVSYDSLLNRSFHVISGKAQLGMSDIMNMKFDEPAILDSQKVIPEKIQYEMSDEGVEVVGFSLKTLKIYD